MRLVLFLEKILSVQNQQEQLLCIIAHDTWLTSAFCCGSSRLTLVRSTSTFLYPQFYNHEEYQALSVNYFLESTECKPPFIWDVMSTYHFSTCPTSPQQTLNVWGFPTVKALSSQERSQKMYSPCSWGTSPSGSSNRHTHGSFEFGIKQPKETGLWQNPFSE